jgi:hypothetical protein
MFLLLNQHVEQLCILIASAEKWIFLFLTIIQIFFKKTLFTDNVHEIIRNGGKCLLPVMALGRAEELLIILEEYWK